MRTTATAFRTRSYRGFSLVEAMIAMTILLLVVLMLVGTVPASFAFTKQDSVRVQAVSAGQSYLDAVRQYVKSSGSITGLPPAPVVAIDQGRGFVSDQTSASEVDFVMTPSCTPRSLFSFDCTVTVTWGPNGPAQSAVVESYIASQAGF